MSSRLSVTGAIVVLMAAIQASADIRVCNHARNNIAAAFGYTTTGGTETKGWYTVEPGKCATPWLGSIAGRSIYYFVSGGGADEITMRPPFFVPGSGTGGCTLQSAFQITGGLNMSQADCASRGGMLNAFEILPTAGLQSVTIGWDCQRPSNRGGGSRSSGGSFVCSSKIEAQQPVVSTTPTTTATKPQSQPQEQNLTPRCLCLFGGTAVAYFIDDGLIPFQPPAPGAVVRIFPSANCPNVLVCEHGNFVSPPGSGVRVRIDSVQRNDNLLNGARTYVVRGNVIN